jgi:hypothetical protein
MDDPPLDERLDDPPADRFDAPLERDLVDDEPRLDALPPDERDADDARAREADDLPPDALARDFEPDAREADLEPDALEPDGFEREDLEPEDLPPALLPREDERPLPPDERLDEPLDLAFAMEPPYLIRDVLLGGCNTAAVGKGRFPGRSAQVSRRRR